MGITASVFLLESIQQDDTFDHSKCGSMLDLFLQLLLSFSTLLVFHFAIASFLTKIELFVYSSGSKCRITTFQKTFDSIKVQKSGGVSGIYGIPHITLPHSRCMLKYLKNTVFWHAVTITETHMQYTLTWHSHSNHTNTAASLLAGLVAGL